MTNRAAKAAGLELLAVSSYFNTYTPGLALPLTTLVNFLGYRLIATSRFCSSFFVLFSFHFLLISMHFSLPIASNTMVYGSSDAGDLPIKPFSFSSFSYLLLFTGKTVHNSNKYFDQMAAYTANRLHLRSHDVKVVCCLLFVV